MSASPVCAAKNCGLSRSTVPDLRLFPFPVATKTSEDRGVLLIWQRVAQIDGAVGKWLCERHFKRMEFNANGNGLVPVAVPTYPTGELNSVTKNYCPRGREHLDPYVAPKTVTPKPPPPPKTVDNAPRIWHSTGKIGQKVALSCLVVYCDNYEGTKGVTLFELPLKDPELLKKWIEVIPLKQWQPNDNHRICSVHFGPESLKLIDGVLTLREGAIPSVFKPPTATPIRKYLENKKLHWNTNCDYSVVSDASVDQIPLLSINGEVLSSKCEVSRKIEEKNLLIDRLTETITKLKETLVEKEINSVVRYLNKNNKVDSSLFIDLFVTKKHHAPTSGETFFRRKRPRIEVKSEVVKLASAVEVTIPKPLPILEQLPTEKDISTDRRVWCGGELSTLVEKLNTRDCQVDVLCSGLFEMIEKWFSEQGMKNIYNEYCWKGIQDALKIGKCSQPKDSHILDSCLILLFFCPKIYHAIRNFLPPLSDILRGKSLSGSASGFTEHSFDALRRHPDRSLVCLSYLEQPIEMEVLWDGSKLRGYCDYGFDAPSTDSIPKASRVLVFFATCLKTDFRIPLGYHLVDQVSAQIIANITTCYLIKLSQNKIKCCAFVSEPEAKSLDVLKCLGFNYDFLRPSSVDATWFPHPEEPTQKIYCFFDSFRLAQQAGYLLVERRKLTVNSLGDIACWKYISDLETVIDETVRNDCKIATNIKYNEEWARIVEKLDMQPSFFLNKTRSKALSFCFRPAIGKIQICRKTVEFIDKINEFYDCCCSTKTQDCLPVTKATKDDIKAKIKELTIYYWNIWVNNGLAKQQGRKMPVPGLLLNLSNLSRLIKDLDHFFEDAKVQIFTSRMNLTRFDEFLAKIRTGGHCSSPFGFQKSYEIEVKNLIESQKKLNVT